MRSNINYIISEEINHFINSLLTEDNSSKSIKAAKKLCIANGMDSNEADNFVRNTMREYMPSLHGLGDKFILGCTRLYWENILHNDKNKNMLDRFIQYICKNSEYYNKFDRNLNNLSFDGLSKTFQPLLKNEMNSDRTSLENKNFKNNGYNIVPINSFEDAAQYSEYFEEDNQWCITYNSDLYDSYSNNGDNQIYFCLKDGFENIDMPEETGNYKDDYGLSMISVIVNPDGSLAYSTTRWNGENGASGSSDLTTQEISRIVGVNFYETFKPNTIFQDELSDCLEKLKRGYSPEEVFDYVDNFVGSVKIVSLRRKYNLINGSNKLLSNQWFDSIIRLDGDLAEVELNGKYNLINKQGTLISSKKWFDNIISYEGGLPIQVFMDGKWNLINGNGDYLSNQWFDWIGNFSGGWVCVKLNDKYNFMNKHGKLLSNIWFNDADYSMCRGLAVVGVDKKHNVIDNHGKILFSQWFDVIDLHYKEGWAKVQLNNQWNFIDIHDKLLSDTWFTDAWDFKDNGWALVHLDYQFNFINKNGDYLSNQWFDDANCFNNDGWAKVWKDFSYNHRTDYYYNYINANGQLYGEWQKE